MKTKQSPELTQKIRMMRRASSVANRTSNYGHPEAQGRKNNPPITLPKLKCLEDKVI